MGLWALIAAFYDSFCNYKAGFKLMSDVSIMTLELIAILQALSYVTQEKIDKVVIFSDSKSSLHHVARCASGFRGTSIVYDILKHILMFIVNSTQLKLQWVPAHLGLQGNEEADCSSKLAAKEGVELDFIPDYVEHVAKFKIKSFSNWKQHFNSQSIDKGIWYKTIQNELPQVAWFDSSTLSRNYVKLSVRLRSGHFPSAKFAFLMKKLSSPNCITCNVIEDVYHLLMECVKNQEERRILINEFNLNISQVGLIQSILSQPKSNLAKRFSELVYLVN